MEIKELRAEIDEIDNQIVALFEKRMALSVQIAQYKRERQLPIYVPEREAEKLEMVAAQAPELEAYVRPLYETIFALSRKHQEAQP